jgi:lauroyl/myristoyl acyltransferase
MRDAVKRGRLVFITLDQGVKREGGGITVRFLGKNISMASGPAQLARHSRAPLLPVLATGHEGAWRFRIEPPLPALSGPLAVEVQRLARITERQVLLHPELWSWHHRRWRRQPFARATIAPCKEDNDPCSTSMNRP